MDERPVDERALEQIEGDESVEEDRETRAEVQLEDEAQAEDAAEERAGDDVPEIKAV